MEVRTHYTSAGLSLNDHVHKGVIDVYEWCLLRAFKNACVNSPDNKNQVTILYGLEMTKPVHVRILCLTIFVFGANPNSNRL